MKNSEKMDLIGCWMGNGWMDSSDGAGWTRVEIFGNGEHVEERL